MSDPDPIIVARDEARVSLVIAMAALSDAERLTFLDLMSLEVKHMADAIEMEGRDA